MKIETILVIAAAAAGVFAVYKMTRRAASGGPVMGGSALTNGQVSPFDAMGAFGSTGFNSNAFFAVDPTFGGRV